MVTSQTVHGMTQALDGLVEVGSAPVQLESSAQRTG
jgi:hypothetical protein